MVDEFDWIDLVYEDIKEKRHFIPFPRREVLPTTMKKVGKAKSGEIIKIDIGSYKKLAKKVSPGYVWLKLRRRGLLLGEIGVILDMEPRTAAAEGIKLRLAKVFDHDILGLNSMERRVVKKSPEWLERPITDSEKVRLLQTHKPEYLQLNEVERMNKLYIEQFDEQMETDQERLLESIIRVFLDSEIGHDERSNKNE